MKYRATQIAAFSLIEILISIVVLSLGLLGLAAVFPAVVRQQRMASDTVQGISMERTVEEYVRSSGALNAFDPNATNENSRMGWQMLTYNTDWSDRGTWVLSEASTAEVAGTGVDPATGIMTMGTGQNRAFIPITERLIPQPYSTGAEPRFVWDFVTRRVIAGAPTIAADDQVQVVVFLRRIDAGIRRGNRSLSDIFTGLGAPLAQSARRVPVAADMEGRPTADGLGGISGGAGTPVYSQILELPFTPYPDIGNAPPRELIEAIAFDRDAEGLYKFAGQIGQKLVDQSGVVHEVVDFIRENDRSNGEIVAFKIKPPLSPAVVDMGLADEVYWTVVFTPQIPVGINVFTVSPGSEQ